MSTPGQARVRPVSTPTSGASIRHATPRAGNGTPVTPRAAGNRTPVTSGTPVRPQATRVPTPQQRQQRPQAPGQQAQLTPVARNGGVSRTGGESMIFIFLRTANREMIILSTKNVRTLFPVRPKWILMSQK